MPDSLVPLRKIHTYHCLCSTHLLTTPYLLASLPARAPPSKDKARILPLPPLPSQDVEGRDKEDEKVLPSLLTNMRPARKAIVVQREDGWERRRMWSCARCALAVGYEIEGADVEGEGRRGRVMYLLEGGLVETAEMMGGQEADP